MTALGAPDRKTIFRRKATNGNAGPRSDFSPNSPTDMGGLEAPPSEALGRVPHASTPYPLEMEGCAGLAHIGNVCIGGRPTVAGSHVHIC